MEKKKVSYEEAIAKLERMREINKKSYLRRQARIAVILRKAAAAGITATEAEIEEELRK